MPRRDAVDSSVILTDTPIGRIDPLLPASMRHHRLLLIPVPTPRQPKLTALIGLAVVLLLLGVLLPRGIDAQGVEYEEEIVLSAGDTIARLSQGWIVDGTFRLIDIEGRIVPSNLFTLRRNTGEFTLSSELRDTLAIRTSPLLLRATYRALPIDLPTTFRSRIVITTRDSTGTEVSRLEPQDPSGGGGLTATDIFGSNFRRSGSISRGVTVGSNRELTLESGLRLEFSGNITDDIEVIGALSDEQTPIAPEGTSRTLQEVDNIFLEVRSPNVDATLGKFFAEDGTSSEFLDFRRKLQGARVVARLGDAGTTQAIAAISPGSFRTQEFDGREGDQGPYRLVGLNGERDIVLLAGTERVFIDGVELVRGIDNDYIIDYAAAEILFQPRRAITPFNEIVVDFEYRLRRYSRSLLAASHSVDFIDSSLRIGVGWMREADDPDAPIDLTYDDADRLLLAAAGADPNGAIRPGERFVGRSDTLSGSYRRVDSLIDGISIIVWVFDPLAADALYDVSFSEAVGGLGDYRSVAFGRYEYVGPGRGSYLPVIYLPLPESQQVATLSLDWQPSGAATTLFGEVALGTANRNRFSDLDGVATNGLALNGGFRTSVDTLTVGSLALGNIAIDGSVRFVDGNFVPIGRITPAEFDREWNTSGRTGETGADDLIGEGRLQWSPFTPFRIETSIGRLVRGDIFASTRQSYRLGYGSPSHRLSFDLSTSLIDSRDTLLDGGGLASHWTKLGGRVGYRIGRVTPAFVVTYQEREDRRAGIDTLVPGAFRFTEAGPDLLLDLPIFRTTVSARLRLDDSVRFDPDRGLSDFLADSRSMTVSARGELLGSRTLRSRLDLSWRSRQFDSIPSELTPRLDNTTILARSETTWRPVGDGLTLTAVYDVQTERAARLERLFVRVPIGQGTFVWTDLDGNGLQSEEEFRETIAGDGEYVRLTLPTEELFPVIDLDADLRLRIEPSRFLSDSTTLTRLLGYVTSETTLRLQEKSGIEDERAIYLLELSRFLDDSTTLLGSSLIGQDITLFDRDPDFTMRLRFQQRQGLTRLFSGPERSASRLRSVTIEWGPTDDVGLAFEGQLEDRSLLGDGIDATRAHDLAILRLESDFSYRPTPALELGWIFRRRAADDAFPAIDRSTVLIGNELRASYAIETKGRLRASIERTVVDGENLAGGDVFSLPFQLTDGYGIGTSWIGILAFDYRFGAHIQATISYTGRSEPPSGRVIHIGSSGVRAFF